MNSKLAAYFERFGFCEGEIAEAPPPELGLVVVVPCLDEPDLIATLESLYRCERPACAVEVLVVINSAAGASEAVIHQNWRSRNEALDWMVAHPDPVLRFHVLHAPNLPPRHAGAGLARKIGMDEALRRFDAAGTLGRGVIVGLDADCACAVNYLRAIEQHFDLHRETPGCSIYFEHPLSGPLPSVMYAAAAHYELHLRYYVAGLRLAGFPHAHHTVGSCMAVRADVYMEQGGMNKRQAGEDFYFLHKIMPLGGFTDLTTTTVYPSARASQRVPFGTGKAVTDYLNGKAPATYALESFLEMRQFISAVVAQDGCLPRRLAPYLEAQRFAAAMQEIRRNTRNNAAFQKRFFRWFDGFKAMKLLHYLRGQCFGERPVGEEAHRLLEQWSTPPCKGEILPLLERYRQLGKSRQILANGPHTHCRP